MATKHSPADRKKNMVRVICIALVGVMVLSTVIAAVLGAIS